MPRPLPSAHNRLASRVLPGDGEALHVGGGVGDLDLDGVPAGAEVLVARGAVDLHGLAVGVERQVVLAEAVDPDLGGAAAAGGAVDQVEAGAGEGEDHAVLALAAAEVVHVVAVGRAATLAGAPAALLGDLAALRVHVLHAAGDGHRDRVGRGGALGVGDRERHGLVARVLPRR